MFPPDHPNKYFRIVAEFGPGVNMSSLPGRPPVPAKIISEDPASGFDEVVDQCHMPAAVISDAGDEHNHRDGSIFRFPALPEKSPLLESGKGAFEMNHLFSHSGMSLMMNVPRLPASGWYYIINE